MVVEKLQIVHIMLCNGRKSDTAAHKQHKTWRGPVQQAVWIQVLEVDLVATLLHKSLIDSLCDWL